MVELTGGCHCGRLTYRLSVPVPVERLPVRACQCGFCTRNDAVWTSHPDGRLDVHLEDTDQMIRYRFGTGTAQFLVCGACGILVLAVSHIERRDYAVVNLRSTESADLVRGDRTRTDFDGEGPDVRLTRRSRNWIPTVTFNEATAG
jgi:hypothetical protein